MWVGGRFNLSGFRHQLFIDMSATRCIEEENVIATKLCFFLRALGNLNCGLAFDDL